MCTVSVHWQNDGIVLTSNRDEQVRRSTLAPDTWEHKGHSLLFPKDQEKGGTWIAVEPGTKRAACLLNGAQSKHEHRPPYRKSRGLVVLDSFSFQSAGQFTGEYAFQGIEPFTLLLLQADRPQLTELTWDGHKTSTRLIPDGRHWLWASSTLYEPEVRCAKQELYRSFLEKQPEPSPADLLHFHAEPKGLGEEQDFVMARPGGLQTVSITQVILGSDNCILNYHELPDNKQNAKS